MIDIFYSFVLYLGMPTLCALAYFRWFYFKEPIYLFSSLIPLLAISQTSEKIRKLILYLLRLFGVLLILFALARPRVPDERSKIPVQGIDIVLALDVSGSMSHPNKRGDDRTKFDIAQEEAIKFIEKRANDAIAFVLFGAVSVSRCPLTLDKKMLKQILKDTYVNIINPDGTVLSRSLLTSLNRLKTSKAKSKVIIALTDGHPSAHDIDPNLAIELAKKLGVKIYTIGIGSEGIIDLSALLLGQMIEPVNTNLLKNISNSTGGQFFMAQDANDLEQIYNEIDQLEKSEQNAPSYGRYFEYFVFLLWTSLFLILLELSLSSLVWVKL